MVVPQYNLTDQDLDQIRPLATPGASFVTWKRDGHQFRAERVYDLDADQAVVVVERDGEQWTIRANEL